MACVTLHYIQNVYRHGTYTYDQTLERIANRHENDDERFDNDDANNDVAIEFGMNVDAIRRQYELILEFNNNQ